MNENPTSVEAQRPDAVVWVDERRAIVARLEPEGSITTVEIRRLEQPENRFLGHVVHEIGSREHVLLVGAAPIRLALERRFVAVGHRPDRLMPVPPRLNVAGRAVVEGLDQLVA